MNSDVNAKSVRKVSESSSGEADAKETKPGRTPSKALGKGDARYWQQPGKLLSDPRSPYLVCKIQVGGRRESFPLKTANKATAAAKAAQIYRDAVHNGMDDAIEKHKHAVTSKSATVGALIEASLRHSTARSESLDTYAKALRRIVAGVKGLDGGKGKFDAFQGGNVAWKTKIDAVPLDELTPTKVNTWKINFLKTAKTPEERNRAIVTMNSLIRNAKALLSKRVLPHIAKELALPSPMFFEGISAEKQPSLRYRSTIDARKILTAAMDELAENDPEALKAFLLSLALGLRRSEADALLWSQFDFDRCTLAIHDTEFKRLKSADSDGDIDLDPELCALFRGYHAKATEDFVLETPKGARLDRQKRKSRSYRCDATQVRLLKWLRQNGVCPIKPGEKKTGKPIHVLRKEIGSIIASRDGIFAASRYLRHSDIRITSAIYADKKAPVTAGLGDLLAGDSKVVEFHAQPTTKTGEAMREVR